MTSRTSPATMHVVIPHQLVVQGDVAEPRVGAMLTLLIKVETFEGALEAPRRMRTVRGVVAWTRHDGGRGRLEMVIVADGRRFLADTDSEDGEGPAVGDVIEVVGRLVAVASEGHVDPTLPDIRSAWLVEQAEQREETLGWHVDARAVGGQ